MDKQKEIEEIAKVIFERGVALESIDFIHGTKGSDHFKRIATALYNAGYRKIAENAVVLTREEYGSLVTRPNLHTAIDVFKVRKETAEKLLDKVDYESNGQTKAITDLLRKEYGV